MADVGATLVSWSNTTASNSPAGSTTIGTGLDDNLREIQGVIVRGLSHKGADIASAATTDLGAIEGLMHDITGTTTITGLGTVRAGILKVIKFEGVLTLTHNATSLILPGGANITTADGDVAIVISEGSGNWRCLHYMPAAYVPDRRPTLGTEQASTSGTSIDFTGIPSWAKQIVIMFDGVSTNGTSSWQVQLGDSGGVETSGYLSACSALTNTVSTTNITSGFEVCNFGAATVVMSGALVLTLEDSANFTWTCSGNLARTDSAGLNSFAGRKATSAALDRVRITTVNGTDTFDAGAINIQYL